MGQYLKGRNIILAGRFLQKRNKPFAISRRVANLTVQYDSQGDHALGGTGLDAFFKDFNR